MDPDRRDADYLLAWLAAMEAAGRPDSEAFVEHSGARLSLAQNRRLAIAASNDHAKLLFSLHHPTARPTREYTRDLVGRESREQAWVAIQRELPQTIRIGWRVGSTTWEERADATADSTLHSGPLVLLADGGFRALNGYGYLVDAGPAADALRRALPRLRGLAAARGLAVPDA